MKVSQAHRATATILHLLLTALTLLPLCHSSPVSNQSTNPASSSPLLKREITMVCTGRLPAGQHNYPPGFSYGYWEGLQNYCEHSRFGPNCACHLRPGGGAAPQWVVQCFPTASNGRFMRVPATNVCHQLCSCQDLPDRSPPEGGKPGAGSGSGVLEPAAVAGVGRVVGT